MELCAHRVAREKPERPEHQLHLEEYARRPMRVRGRRRRQDQVVLLRQKPREHVARSPRPPMRPAQVRHERLRAVHLVLAQELKEELELQVQHLVPQ